MSTDPENVKTEKSEVDVEQCEPEDQEVVDEYDSLIIKIQEIDWYHHNRIHTHPVTLRRKADFFRSLADELDGLQRELRCVIRVMERKGLDTSRGQEALDVC